MSLTASIDVGSNTLRLLIGRMEENRIVDIFSDRRITRLGSTVAQTGRLQNYNIESSIAALKEFSAVIAKLGVRRVKAIATSALREASDSDVFIRRAFDATGIAIEVITGEKEAELTLKGVLLSFPETECLAPRLPASLPREGQERSRTSSLFIVDIGGGSTEWISCGSGETDMGSIPIGVIKLAQTFLEREPVDQDDLKKLDGELVPVIEALKTRTFRLLNRRTQFIGTAGTFATIASIDLGLDVYSREKIHLHRISLAGLRDMRARLLGLSPKERRKLKGLEPQRADLIIPGIHFTIELMASFEFDELTISDYGLLEGALLDNEQSISETGEP
jgi:exopolyphosphatase/guanosine-5'-triphosphate,3'-diphosphate pyrophosphatase